MTTHHGAAQLLKEHLQGEGQWLTRYGDAPEPTPGAGAGVIGGDRDGDMGFMGVEAMTRYSEISSTFFGRSETAVVRSCVVLVEDGRIAM